MRRDEAQLPPAAPGAAPGGGTAASTDGSGALDGFWLPRHLREWVTDRAAWDHALLRGGALVEPAAGDGAPGEGARATEGSGAVAVRWPRLGAEEWAELLDGLGAARAVPGAEAAARWEIALSDALGALAERMPRTLPLLAASTGYSPEMLATAFAGGDLLASAALAPALDLAPTWAAARRWETLPGLEGRLRFYPQGPSGRARGVLKGSAPLFRPAPPAHLALGFAAGNVPGTALMISLLASLADHAMPVGTPAPAVLVRNSRHEPLFTPWVLSAVEEVDPELVASMAVMIWDYADPALQALFLRKADLLVAAADDATIAALDAARSRHAPGFRFHRHGHKVSFVVLGREWADRPDAPTLAALDSCFWDQNGCLSARLHFVEGDAPGYARRLADEMRALSSSLPRGSTPLRFAHRAFDSYAALGESGGVRLMSSYDDDFAVIVDDRPWDAGALGRTVNRCQGRVVVVRPVRDVMHVHSLLRALPAANLQTVSLLLGEDRLEDLAHSVAARGVTAIRPLGRGAFPRLTHSWDGLLPLDSCCLRPPGRFATIEPAIPTA